MGAVPGQELVVLAAVGRNGAIGRDGGLIWHLPGDLPRVKQLTTGHTLVMGRKTFDSIGRPLPDRRSVVVTRSPGWSHPGVEVAHSLPDALGIAGAGTVFLFGGGEIYAQGLEWADRMELTEVDDAPEADAFFPPWDRGEWEETRREEHDGFAYVSYVRR